VQDSRWIHDPDQLEAYLRQREASDEAEYAEPSLVRLAVCRIGEQLYAMPADGLKQVCKVESVAYVPGCPSVIAGLIQVGGEILGAVDLAKLLSVEGASDCRKGYAMIYEFGSERIGLLVSAIKEVVEVPVDDICEQDFDQHFAYAVSEIQYFDNKIPYIDLQRALSSLLDLDEEMPV